MATSPHYIPVDSSHEAVLAQKLVEENRCFAKPLKLLQTDSMLPDFVLTDTNPAFVLEVFGMSSSEYFERKAQKLEQYRAAEKPVWSWNVDSEKHPPRLPPPSFGLGIR